MAGLVVDRLPHSCGSNRGLNVFQNEDGKYSGWCFSCKKYVDDPYHDKPKDYKPPVGFKKTPEEIQKEVNAIGSFKSFALPDRKLRKDTVEYFDVRCSVSEVDGETVTAHYYPYTNDDDIVGYKIRIVDGKRFWGIGNTLDVDLFGWDQAIQTGAKRLYITEGEIDAMSLYQILKDNNEIKNYAQYVPAVVSLPHGSSGASKDLSRLAKKIREHFKEIVFVFDMDAPGRKAVDDCMLVFPEAVSASLPAKDANECLKEGRSQACIAAVVFNAKKPKNTRIVHGEELREAAKAVPQYGASWPWKQVTEATRGIRLGETIYIGAAPKMGKSEIVNTITAHCIKEHNWKVFLCKPEEANVKTYKLVAGKMVGKFFHDPAKEFDEKAFDKAADMIGDSLMMLNLCLLYTSPSPRDGLLSRMPSSA